MKSWKNRVDEIIEEDENTNTINSKDDTSEKEKTLEYVNSQSNLNKLENDEDSAFINDDYLPKDDEHQDKILKLEETEGEPLELENPENGSESPTKYSENQESNSENPMGTYICNLNNIAEKNDSNDCDGSDTKTDDKDMNTQYEEIVDKIKALEMLDSEDTKIYSKKSKEKASYIKSLEINDFSENYIDNRTQLQIDNINSEAYIELWDKPTIDLIAKQKDDKGSSKNDVQSKTKSNYITDIESNSFIKKTFKKFHKIKTEGDDIDHMSEDNSADNSGDIVGIENIEIKNVNEQEIPQNNSLNKSADIVLNKKLEIALIAGKNVAFPSHRQNLINENQTANNTLQAHATDVQSPTDLIEPMRHKLSDAKGYDKSKRYRHFTNYKSSQQDKFLHLKEYKS